jgi:hypothetical protein
MYIIAIGWLYVAILAAATEGSLFGGIITFLFWGMLPCALFMWLGNARARRQRRLQLLADQRPGDDDRRHAETDQ